MGTNSSGHHKDIQGVKGFAEKQHLLVS